MHPAIVLCTLNDLHAEAILSSLPWLQVVRCRDEEATKKFCQTQDVCLALIVEDLPYCESHRMFAELSALHPNLAGVLFAPTIDMGILHKALETGFSGLVELPVNPVYAGRIVKQALEKYWLRQENTRLRTLVPLYRLGEQFAAASDEQGVLDRLLDAVEQQTGATRSSVMLHDPQEDCLRIVTSRGMDANTVESTKQQPGDQIAGWVFQEGKPVLLNKEDQAMSIFSPLLQQPDVISAISFPLKIRDRIIGVVNISQKQTDKRFSEADNEMLAILTSQAALALENLRARLHLAETTRMRTLFEQYVAPEVAALLLAQNSDLMELGGIQQATVLFADIRNFTRLAQHIDLQSLRSFLNEFFQFFTEEVFRHRGMVDKFMGDAVLAVFGAPVKLEAPSLAAVQAAMAIKEKFTILQQQWISRSEEFQRVDLGIGVTSGAVFLGNIGSAKRLDYTVIGNEVNVAQRLAAESSDCQIYTTGAVCRAIADHFVVDELGEVQLRGVEKKIKVYCPSGEKKPGA